MKRINVGTEKKYDVLIGRSLLEEAGALILDVLPPCRLLILTDTTVEALYGNALVENLSRSGFDVVMKAFPPGEASKSLPVYGECQELLASEKFTRTDGIIALGGGVPGDLAGFAAATYLRGIRWIQIPTTFLAAIDSSVGGKTGINLTQGKNLTGAFWQPSLVICDPNTFRTLEPDVFLDGVAEAIKYGIILDKHLFAELRAIAPLQKEASELESIIASCVKIKGKIVAIDERDTGVRQLLNLGHTVGHAIERCSNYAISHGHGVATGIAVITRASQDFGYTSPEDRDRILELLELHGFDLQTSFSAEELLPVILQDKKRGGSNINLILPTAIGDSEIREFPVHSLEGFIKAGLR